MNAVPKPKAGKRCVLYGRYSTDLQRKESLDDQWHACEQVAAREGLTVVERYGDPEVSGGTQQRKDYQRMLDAARRGEFDLIVVEDVSRLWRNRSEYGARSAELEDLGVHLLTCVGQNTARDGWSLTITVLAAMAEQQRREIGYRTRRGLSGLARAGRPTGGRCYGYLPHIGPDGRKSRVVNEAQAKHVRWMFEKYASGWSRERLARQFNGEGVPPPSASHPRAGARKHVVRWTSSAIEYILRNPLYKGRLVWQRTQWTPSARDSKKRRVERLDPSAWITSQDESLRLVSDALWEKVQHRIQTATTPEFREAVRAGQLRVGHESAYLLGGIIRCAICGRNYVGNGVYDYLCPNHDGTRQGCSNAVRFRRDDVHETVVALLRQHWLSNDSIAAGVAYVEGVLREQQREEERHARPQADAAVLRRLDEEAKALRSVKLRPEALAAGLAAIEAERAALKERATRSRSATESRAAQLIQRIPQIVVAYERKVAAATKVLAKREHVDEGRILIGGLIAQGHIVLAPNAEHTAVSGEVVFKDLGTHFVEVLGFARRHRGDQQPPQPTKAERESGTCSWAVPRAGSYLIHA